MQGSRTEAEKKQGVSLVKERKHLQLLEELKEYIVPFINDKEVEKYLDDPLLTDKDKQKRIKKEIQFACDSSTTLPKVNPIFKIQVKKGRIKLKLSLVKP